MENKQARKVLLIEDQAEQPSPIRAMFDRVDSSAFQAVDVESICNAEKHLAMNPVEVVLLDLESRNRTDYFGGLSGKMNPDVG